MSRRTRFLAGLLASIALTLSFAESVWASTCAPGMQMDAPATAVPSSDTAPPLSHCGTGQHEMDDGRHAPGDERPCPFSSPAAAQACAGVASVPAPAMAFFASWSRGAPTAFSVETRSDLLLEVALFRPPRA